MAQYERITELEKTVAFQEQKIQDLTEGLLEQGRHIKRLERALKQVQTRTTEEELVYTASAEDERPPHY